MGVEERTVVGNPVLRRRLVVAGQEVERRLRRAHRMDTREFAPEPFGQLHPIAAIAAVLDQQVAGGGAADAAHQEEGTADDRGVVAQPQRLRHGHAGLEHGLQQGELLRPAVTDRNTGGRRVAAQHALVAPGQGPAVHGQVDQPVLLHGATGQLAHVRNHDRSRTGRVGDEGFDRLTCVVVHGRAHSPLTRCARSTATQAPDIAPPAADASSSNGPSRSLTSQKRRLGMRMRSLSPASLVRKSRFRSVMT